jgi:hypothetical protein
MTKRGLIEKILKAATDGNQNVTPAATKTLSLDPGGAPFNIRFAMSQIAQHNPNPKQSQGIVIKAILRYLN